MSVVELKTVALREAIINTRALAVNLKDNQRQLVKLFEEDPKTAIKDIVADLTRSVAIIKAARGKITLHELDIRKYDGEKLLPIISEVGRLKAIMDFLQLLDINTLTRNYPEITIRPTDEPFAWLLNTRVTIDTAIGRCETYLKNNYDEKLYPSTLTGPPNQFTTRSILMQVVSVIIHVFAVIADYGLTQYILVRDDTLAELENDLANESTSTTCLQEGVSDDGEAQA